MKPKRAYPDVPTYLREAGVTQEQFATRVGISPSYLSMLLSGLRTPPLDLAMRIASEANVPIESLAPPSSSNEATR